MKKISDVMVGLLIIACLGAAVCVGYLLYKDYFGVSRGYSFIEFFRDDGTLEREVCFKDGVFVRVTKIYSEDGVLEKEAFNDGSYRMYYENGNIRSEIIKDKENFNKYTVKAYYKSGKLNIALTFEDGKLLGDDNLPFNGVYKYYDRDGNIRREETYVDGIMNGPWRVYYKSGRVKLDFVSAGINRYISGKSYYEDGEIETNIEQRPEGPVMVKYSPSGEPITEYNLF